MLLTLDSSVIIASLLEKEQHHTICKKLMEQISNTEHAAVMPYTVLVEVVAAIKRRTFSEKLAERIGEDLQNIGTIYFLNLSKYRANEAAQIANKTNLKGMDAIVVQIAKEYGAILVTL